MLTEIILAVLTSGLYYAPAYYMQKLIAYLETDPTRKEPIWGWIYCLALFFVTALNYILTGMLWSISTTNLQSRIKIQLNTMLFAKTLVRKDVAGGAAPTASVEAGVATATPKKDEDDEDNEEDVTSKSQVMTLMTVDVDRVADFSFHSFSLVSSVFALRTPVDFG